MVKGLVQHCFDMLPLGVRTECSIEGLSQKGLMVNLQFSIHMIGAQELLILFELSVIGVLRTLPPSHVALVFLIAERLIL